MHMNENRSVACFGQAFPLHIRLNVLNGSRKVYSHRTISPIKRYLLLIYKVRRDCHM